MDMNNSSQGQEIQSMDISVRTPLNDKFWITIYNSDDLLEENISKLKERISRHMNGDEFHLEPMDRSDFTQDDVIQLHHSRKLLAKSILRDKGIDIHPKSLLTDDLEIVELLIETEEVDIHAEDDWALIRASYRGHSGVVKLLLAHDADVHAKDDEALRCASYHGQLVIVKLLLAHGADVHAKDDDALRWASKKGHLEVVRLLLDHGADVHAKDDEALRWASMNGHLEVVKLLLDHGADVHAGDDEALMYAIKEGHLGIARLLVDHGAEVHAIDYQAQDRRMIMNILGHSNT